MIYAFLATGFEEVEAITPIDLLRRCELEVVTVGIGGKVITGAHGITIVTDIADNELLLNEDIDMLVLPGGMPGTLNLEASAAVRKAISYVAESGKYLAAICAAPSILGHMGLLNGKEAICFPGFETQLQGCTLSNSLVCVDGNIITAKGAGLSLDFSLKLVELLCSKERSDLLKASLQCV